jgi:hypothetical protein
MACASTWDATASSATPVSRADGTPAVVNAWGPIGRGTVLGIVLGMIPGATRTGMMKGDGLQEPEAVVPLHLALGQSLLAAGRPVEALAELEQAAAGGATLLGRRARWLRCEAMLGAGLLPQAASQLEALLREAPEDPEALPGRLRLMLLEDCEELLARGRLAALALRGDAGPIAIV